MSYYCRAIHLTSGPPNPPPPPPPLPDQRFLKSKLISLVVLMLSERNVVVLALCVLHACLTSFSFCFNVEVASFVTSGTKCLRLPVFSPPRSFHSSSLSRAPSPLS